MARSPLTQKIQAAQSMVDQVNALEADVRDLVLDILLPEPEEAPKQKKTRKKRTSTKSNRAAGMASAIKDSIQKSKEASANDAEQPEEEGPFCGICHHNEAYQDHYKPSPNYHEFEAPKKVAA